MKEHKEKKMWKRDKEKSRRVKEYREKNHGRNSDTNTVDHS